MTRHTIVLAEEKETIRRLVKKAVENKPLGQEKIENVLTVTDDATLVEALSRPNSPVSILLLSTTFSTRSHESLIGNIAERYPGVKVISLTHKYGDRSSMDYGAFESVDKPIRNPVLWERIDRAIESIEATENSQDLQSTTIEKTIDSPEPPTHQSTTRDELPVTVPVIDFSFHDEPDIEVKPVVEPEMEEVIPKLAQIQDPSTSTPLIISDDDDSGDDDLFGEIPTYKKRVVPFSPIVIEDTPVVVIEEEYIEPENELLFPLDIKDSQVQDEPHPETVAHSKPEYTTVLVSTEENLEIDIQEDEPQLDFSLDLTETIKVPKPLKTEVMAEVIVETSNVFDSYQDESDGNDKVTLSDVELVEAVEAIEETLVTPTLEPIPPSQPPINKPPSNTLEPNEEINIETSTYNELSEWTFANEGFRTKNGDFVPLAPPRELMSKYSSSNGRLLKTTAQKAEKHNLTDSDNLFSSVKNIFKKK